MICTICARGGSKGVPGKNIRPMLGLPLIAYSIDQARSSGLFEAIAVSSDDPEILSTAKKYGAEILVKRPSELATDTAGKLPVIQHCFLEAEKKFGGQFDIVVDLDVTSPLRTPEDIVQSVEMLFSSKANNVITGNRSRKSPYFNLVEQNEAGWVQLAKTVAGQAVVSRQAAPKTYDMNASIYVWTRKSLLNNDKVITDRTSIYVMPEDRSIDIDSEIDWKLVELLMTDRVKSRL